MADGAHGAEPTRQGGEDTPAIGHEQAPVLGRVNNSTRRAPLEIRSRKAGGKGRGKRAQDCCMDECVKGIVVQSDFYFFTDLLKHAIEYCSQKN